MIWLIYLLLFDLFRLDQCLLYSCRHLLLLLFAALLNVVSVLNQLHDLSTPTSTAITPLVYL